MQTGKILNREAFEEYCRSRKAGSDEQEFSAIILLEIADYNVLRTDLGFEKFIDVNNQLGDRLESILEDGMFAARMYHATYVVGLYDISDYQSLRDKCEQIRKRLTLLPVDGHTINVNIGAVLCYDDPERGIIYSADRALQALNKAAHTEEHLYVAECSPDRRCKRTRVAMLDDPNLMTFVLPEFIRSSRDFGMEMQSEDPEDILRSCAKGDIDLAILNVDSKFGLHAFELAQKIKKSYPKIRILMISSLPEISFLDRAREAGIDSFWYRERDLMEVLNIVERTMKGESVYPEHTPNIVIGKAFSHDFTEREIEVLKELMLGRKNQEIAANLYMSVSTVKDHMTSMLEKTDTKSRTELAVLARDAMLVIPEWEK